MSSGSDPFLAQVGAAKTVDPASACRAVIAHHSKSFSLASKLLPSAVRNDAVIVYAWCRRADDAVDLAPAAEQASAVERLTRELDHVYAGEPTGDLVLDALAEVVARRRLPSHYPRELLAGMLMDVTHRPFADERELALYCYRVAGVVGLMMCHVLGVANDRALRHAHDLGAAMQLTNIARDVLEDWDRGRLYLPATWFSEPIAKLLGDQIHSGAPLPTMAAEEVRTAVGRLLTLADTRYLSGDAGLRYLDARSAFSIRTARKVYSAIGHRLRRQGCDVWAGRTVVPLSTKLIKVAWALGETLVDLPVLLGMRLVHGPQRFLPPQDVLRFDDAQRA